MEEADTRTSKHKWFFGIYISILLIFNSAIVIYTSIGERIFFTPLLILPGILILSIIFTDLTRQELEEVSLDSRFLNRKSFYIAFISLMIIIALIAFLTLSILSRDGLVSFYFFLMFLTFLIIVASLSINTLVSFEILLSSEKSCENYQMKYVYSNIVPSVTLIIGLSLFVRFRDASIFAGIIFLVSTLILFLIIFVIDINLILSSRKLENKIRYIHKKNKKKILLEVFGLLSILFLLVFFILILVEVYIFDVHNIFPAIKVTIFIFSILSFSVIISVFTVLFIEIMRKN
jgi:hypothetical protein